MTISSRALHVCAQAAGPSPGSSPHKRHQSQHPQSHSVSSRRVLVASKNPVKVNAVQRALQRCFPSLELTVWGRETPSNVPDQPRGDEETLKGARNRVSALSASVTTTTTTAPETTTTATRTPAAASCDNSCGGDGGVIDLMVSIEGGVGPATAPGQAGVLECFAWVCVRDPHTGAESTARTASFALPRSLSDLILKEGMELGDADDAVFGCVRSKQGSGTIGKLSNGVLDRTEYYVQATVCALLPYMQPQLYGMEYGGFLRNTPAARQ
ncbi:hypothetical protein VOLCADRAFT_105402 [Volvox carteri f. nagariensis]|uniref:inosine/xanthosine triphosphatase n=1 Tax=Volvox carteri f. nagariensis TaxID=3068 RepID=D8U0L5_VOLCA|nr:uncharacterized protein VOLCADRAFT_105402 [Volvox carteri f. nagariensis]EFJ46655.1 hypothetical protein VOLCADRAFT_105402 [Volvox carteri f. nagariensis]|eukprot:XP_002952184.1 hypothetical protein VOLCADRAFT_105402 [Volvox carteri f. nagariensis]